MFQNNALSGFIMLAGIALGSWQMALLAVAGNAVSTITALLLVNDRAGVSDGLYGFNGTLVGIAVGVFMPVTLLTLSVMAAASCLSTAIVRLFSMQKMLPGFTAPFIISVWTVLFFCSWAAPSLLFPPSVACGPSGIDFVKAFCLNFGQVMFQSGTLWTGLSFIIGILVNSPRGALYALSGSLLSIVFSILLGYDTHAVNMGLSGYNGILCALAFESPVRAAAAVVLSVLIQYAGMAAGITTLTAPFVVSVWIVLLLKRKFHSGVGRSA